MRCILCPGNPARRFIPVVLMILTLSALSAGGAHAKDASFLLFDLSPSSGYEAQRNGLTIAAPNATPAGAINFTSATAQNDRFVIFESGGALPPSAPTGVVAVGDDVGCAAVTWNANPESDIAVYRVYWGSSPGVYSDSVTVATTQRTVCGFTDGTWYFGVRASNMSGLLGAMSNEVSASISNGSAQPPLPPQFVSVAGGSAGCMSVQWFPSSDPSVVGYLVEYGPLSVAAGDATEYDNATDAGNTTSVDICGLPGGMQYVVVRARNHLDMISVPSVEHSVDLVTTTVLINQFVANAADFGVHLEWDVFADEAIRGFRLTRSRPGVSTSEIQVGPTGLLSPATSRLVDNHIEGDTEYTYALIVVKDDGSEIRSRTINVRTNPLGFRLDQNVPNPFNPATAISFVIPAPALTRITVHNARGALVTTIVERRMPAGRATVYWDGTDSRGHRVASGAYFYRLAAGSQALSRKMILLK